MTIDPLKIIREISVPATIDHVWEFITDQNKMKQWLQADEFIIDILEGGKIVIPLSFDGKKYWIFGEIGLILPKTKFVFTWNEKDPSGATWFTNTMVTLNLEEVEFGTQLTLVHDGFNYLPPEIQEEVFQRYTSFWYDSDIMERFLMLTTTNR